MTEITKENFREHFFDVRNHKPKKGQIMAKYTAVADFVSGQDKKDIIHLLKIGQTHQAAQIMRKIHLCRQPDCYRVLREICEDLLSGMLEVDVENKPYEFILEAYFYTQRENVPKDDPRWETIDLIQYDPETKTFKCNIEI